MCGSNQGEDRLTESVGTRRNVRGDSNQGEDPRTGRRRLSVSGEHLGGVTLEGMGQGMEVGQTCGTGVPGLTNFQFGPAAPKEVES